MFSLDSLTEKPRSRESAGPHRPIADTVTLLDTLRMAIVRGDLQPGRRLVELDLAAELLDRLRYKSVRYQFRVALLPGRPAIGGKEHLAVIEAVTSGSPDLAEHTMREHLTSVISALRQLSDLGLLAGQFDGAVPHGV